MLFRSAGALQISSGGGAVVKKEVKTEVKSETAEQYFGKNLVVNLHYDL